MKDDTTINHTAEADAVARLAAKPFIESIQGVPFLLAPSGEGNWMCDNMSHLLPAPIRKSGTVTCHEIDSFIDVVKRQGSLAECNIYLDVDYAAQKIKATAIFNDHGEDQPGWQDHRAVFVPRFSEEWKRWNQNNKQMLEQIKLAHFLEENIGDIAAPDGSKLPSGADVLTFVSKLEETRKVKYGSGVNLQNGMVQLEFIEDGDSATKGKLDLFREFAIGVRPFFNGDAYQVRAFLRYRIDRNSGGITFWYELQRPDRVLEDACTATIEAIRAKTGMPVVFGTLDK